MSPLDCLRSVIEEHAPLVIALSGGTDSMTLLAIAAGANVPVAAVTVDNGLNPSGEIERAVAVAERYGIRHELLDFDAFSLPEVAGNAPDRCYVCKKMMMQLIRDWAEHHGYRAVADGSHADDDPGDRPGIKALRELGIISPYASCGIGRSQIAVLAEETGISVLPSSSCMATRFPEGTALSPGEIERARRAEALLRPLVKGRLRVRVVRDVAVVEAEPSEYEAVMPRIVEILAMGFVAVRFQPRMYKER